MPRNATFGGEMYVQVYTYTTTEGIDGTLYTF